MTSFSCLIPGGKLELEEIVQTAAEGAAVPRMDLAQLEPALLIGTITYNTADRMI